ncbi:MAG: integrase arm-type DNA-binding domain-containing protein, partial [Casimicrobiaceae bacterium]
MPLTTTAVRNAKPRKSPYKMADERGLFLLVSPSGGKWWRFKYRFGGKEKGVSLGVFPDVSLADARDRRDAARKLLANAIDPGEQRKEAKREAAGRAANSFEAVAREWYTKQTHTWNAKHADDVLRRLEANLFPEIGATPICELEAPDLLKAIQVIERRGAHDLAHRVLQVAGQVLRYGIATGKCKRDLSRD